MKHVFFKLFVLCLLCIAGRNAFSQPISVDGIEYMIFEDEGFASVQSLDNVHESDLEISPSITIQGVTYPVTRIENSVFRNRSGLMSIIIPNSITSIPSNAFEGCSNLVSITFPQSLLEIGPNAFVGTPWFDNQPDGVVYINQIAYCYKGDMPKNTSITIKEGTKIISRDAFAGCIGLTSINIPEGVTTIGYGAFRGCANLVNITIPNSIIEVGERVCNQTPWYDSQPDGLVYFGNVVLGYKGAMPSNLVLKEGTTSIASGAFQGLSNLKELSLPNSVTTICSYAFNFCSDLTSINIPNSVTTICSYAFQPCI